ncbi:MAG: Hpt domain-containing protein [Opitutus sp.]
MADPAVIDPRAIENIRSLSPGDNDEFLREIVTIFLEDTPMRITELDDSLVAGDAPKFTRAAHSIKGSSANLGATALRLTAERLEAASRTNGLGGVTSLMDEVKFEYERAKSALCAVIGT